MRQSLQDFSLVECEYSYKSALKQSETQTWDVLVTDYFLPDGNGLGLIQEVRAQSPQTKSILISGSTTKEMAMEALNKNISGIIEKPFTQDEFKKILGEVLGVKKTIKKISVNDRDLTVSIEDQKIKFTSTEFKIFKFLYDQPRERFCRKTISRYVWGSIEISENTLDTHLCNIKKKMGKHSAALTNVKGAGYAIDFSDSNFT